MVAAKKVFPNRSTSRVKYRTAIFIKTVFNGGVWFPQYTVVYILDIESC